MLSIRCPKHVAYTGSTRPDEACQGCLDLYEVIVKASMNKNLEVVIWLSTEEGKRLEEESYQKQDAEKLLKRDRKRTKR